MRVAKDMINMAVRVEYSFDTNLFLLDQIVQLLIFHCVGATGIDDKSLVFVFDQVRVLLKWIESEFMDLHDAVLRGKDVKMRTQRRKNMTNRIYTLR